MQQSNHLTIKTYNHRSFVNRLIGCSVNRFLFILLFVVSWQFTLSLPNGLIVGAVRAQVPTAVPTLDPAIQDAINQAQIGALSGGAAFGTNPWIISPESITQSAQNGSANYQVFGGLTIPSTLMSSTIIAVAGSPTQQQVLDPNGQPLTQNGQPVYETVYQGGAIDMVGSLTASLYSNKPASSIEYLADLGNTLGVIKPAYAQGLGFSAFSPVLELWKIFRNITYLAFVIIFIIVGFMIMFRKKIDPRTVVTIQDALPRIIVTLIIITFSYAIAGFIIDLSDLSTKLIANIFFSDGKTILGTTNPQASMNDVLNSDVFKLVNPLRNVRDLVGAIQQTTSVGVNSSGGGIVAGLAGLTVGVVLWIAGFYVMFKIFFALLTPFVTIVLSIIFAPFQLLVGAIPGNNAGFLGWFKNIIANAAVFPVTFTMMAISAFLHSGPLLNSCRVDVVGFGPSALWCPPNQPITSLWTPFGLNLGTTVGHIAGFGILFTIPHVIQIVTKALDIKPSPVSAGGEELRKAFGRLPFAKSMVE